jgi:phage I-like protein
MSQTPIGPLGLPAPSAFSAVSVAALGRGSPAASAYGVPGMGAGQVAVAALRVEIPAGQVPTDVRLIPAGEFRSVDGRPTDCSAWVMEAADGERCVAAMAARESALVIDYEHATLHAKRSGSKAPAAGWFKALEWRSDGLWATQIEWTALAAQHIAAREYRYLSPVFAYDPQSGRVRQLLHAALTNDPGLDGLTDLAALAADLFLPPTTSRGIAPMNELLKKLLAALGLQESATEAEALAALAALKTNVATLSAQVAHPDPARFVPIATLTALQAEHADAQGRLTALTAEVSAGKIEQAVSDGLTAGKLTPATETWARELGKTNLAALTAFLAAAPVVVALGQTQSGGKGSAGAGGAALSETELAVCRATGTSPEDFLKHRRAAA